MLPLIFLAAQEEGGEQASGSNWMFLFYIAVFVGIFYFLLIRPGQKQKKEHQRLVDSVKKGDEVISAGGVYGTVNRVGDDFVMVEIAKKTVVKLSRASIARIVSAEEVEEEEDIEEEEDVEEEELAGEPAEQDAQEPLGEPAEEPTGQDIEEKGEGQPGASGRER